MGQIASAPCGTGLGPSTACSAATWEDVDDLQTQPIDIRHFLRRAEDEAKCWKAADAGPVPVQPIRLLPTPADQLTKATERASSKWNSKPQHATEAIPPVIMTPDEASAVLPRLMDDRWVYPVVAMVGSKDAKVAEMALASLTSILDSESRQAMALQAQCIPKLVHALTFAHHQRAAFDACTALCNGNRVATVEMISNGVVDTVFDVCKLKLSNADDRKCSALQLLAVLAKQLEGKTLVATLERATLLVDFLSHTHAPIAFYALSCLSELFHCESARKDAIRLGVIPTLLRYLHASTTCNKTILLQAVYALSILGTHESDAFPMAESVKAICQVMEILRGALKRSRLASLVCMFVTGLSWKHPSCQRFQHALRDNAAPNLFAILASLLIGGSNDVLCAAALAVGALSHRCLPNVQAFAKLDVHTILAKMLPHKDDRVVTCVAMALTRFLTAFTLQAKHMHLLWEPWQQDVAQAISTCSSPDGTSLDILYTAVLRKYHKEQQQQYPLEVDPLDVNNYQSPSLSFPALSASAFELQAALDLFVVEDEKRRWANDEAVDCLLHCVTLAATDMQLELLLFFQTCTNPLGGDIEPVEFCNLFLVHDGLSLFLSLLESPTLAPSHLCSVLHTLKHLTVAYYTSPWPQPPSAVVDMVQHVVALIARVDNLDVQRLTTKLLDVLTETKCCQVYPTLTTLLASNPHSVANLLFANCHSIQHGAGIVVSRVVHHSRGQWTPLPSALLQLTALLQSPSHDVTYAASHAWGSLLDQNDLCLVFSTYPDGVPALLDLLEAPTRRPKHLVDTGRTLYRATKHPEIQPLLVGRGLALLERLMVHPVDAVGHYVMLTLGLVGKNDALRPAVVTPTLVAQLRAFVASGSLLLKGDDDDPNVASFPEPRRLSNLMDALCWIGEVAVDAATQQVLLHAGVVDQVANVVLTKGPMSDVKLCALSAMASLCSSDPTTRNHVLGDALVDAVLRHLDTTSHKEGGEEIVLICLNILLHLLRAPTAQGIIAKSPRMGNIVQTLRYTSDKVRSLAAQVLAMLARRHDAVKADMCRMDVNNILLNVVVAESHNDDDDDDRKDVIRINAASRVQRHALHAMAVLCEGTSPAAKTNKHETLDFPLAMNLTDLLEVPGSDDAVESTALLGAVLANTTYHSARNQRLLLQRGVEAKCIALVQYVFATTNTTSPSSFSEMLAVESMKTLTNLATHPENRKEMGTDQSLYGALLIALQSDVSSLHRFASLTIAHLCTGSNDPHKIAIGAYGGLLPALAERLSSKDPHVLENVCFAITKLGTHGGNKIVFGANLIFERLLPLVLHAEVAIQKMAMTAIAILIEGNDRNKASLVECNAIPILCSLCNDHNSVHGRILEGALHTLSELVIGQVVEVSKYINPTMVIDMLGSVNCKLQKAALVLLAHLTKESFNKLRFGAPPCIAALVTCLHTMPRTDDSNDERRRDDLDDSLPISRSLLDSEADLALVELAATSLANLSFEATNTTTIVVDADPDNQLMARLGELMESAMQIAYDSRASPSKVAKKQQLSPLKAKQVIGSPNQDQSADSKSATSEQRVVAPLLASRPMQCQHILEQCALIVNNCAHVILRHGVVTEPVVAIVCRMLAHSSDLVKKCACFALTTWCSKQPQHQQWVLSQPTAVLSTLIGMLNSSSQGIVEASLWILTKLSMYQDTYVKMAANDIVRILEHMIFRYHTTLGSGVLDRAIRLLGNLGLHDVVRKTIRGEVIVAGPLTSILEHQKGTDGPSSMPDADPSAKATTATAVISHVKNVARLIGILLTDDALKLFFPKKTLTVLQTIYVGTNAPPVKVRRNIIVIFWLLSVVEEHRPLLAHPDKDVVGRLVMALARDEHELYVRANVLAMLAMWSQHDTICQTLYARDIVASVLKYLVVPDLSCDTFCAVIIHHLSNLKDTVRTKLAAEGTTEIVVSLLERCVSNPAPFDPFGYHLVGILANLTVQDEVKSVVVHVHGIHTILAFLRQNINYKFLDDAKGGDVLDLFAKVVANLSFDDTCKPDLIDLGGLELVLQVLSRQFASLAGVENYVLCVGNLSTIADSIPRLEATSAIPILLDLLELHQSTSPWIVKCAIWAISNMTLDSATSKHQLHGYPGGLDLVLSLLVTEKNKQTDTIIECALSCLSSIVMEEEIACSLGKCPAIGHILRFLEPHVRQSLQRKAVKTIGCLASFGHAVYIDDLSRTHTHLLSIATDANLKSIAPSAINALRRISHLRNESPHVLCDNVQGIDALLKLIQVDAASTVLDALHLIHHIATVTAPISSNAEYFASKRTCTQASELLVSSSNVEIQESAVRLCVYLVKQTNFDGCSQHAENWALVLSRLCRWWEQHQSNLSSHELCPSLLAGFDQMMAFPVFIRTLNDAILTKPSLKCLADLLPALVAQKDEPGGNTLPCVRSLVHLVQDHSYYKAQLQGDLPAQLLQLLLVTPDEETAILLVVLRGMEIYCSVPPTVCDVFVQVVGAVRLLHLLFDLDVHVVAKALATIHLLVHEPTAPGVFRMANGVGAMATKLKQENLPKDNNVKLLLCLAALWEDTPATCSAFHDSHVISVVMAKTLEVHFAESLTLLQGLSTSISFHAALFNHAATFLELLRRRTSHSGNDTVLLLLIMCNMCCCGPSFDHDATRHIQSFAMEWVDMNVMGTLLPLSQWMDGVQPPRRSAKVSPRWETETELVLRMLGQIARDPHLRLVFRDGVDLPDLLSLLRPQLSTSELLGMGVLRGAAQVLANISLEKDIQIMIIVEDGVTFLAKLLMLQTLPQDNDGLALALVQTVRNLSHDSEVQAILGAHHTFPYFIQQMQVLAAMSDMASSSGLEVLSVEIIHDIATTPQWVDTLVGDRCHDVLLALIDRHVDECHHVPIELLAVQTLVQLTQTSHVKALCASNTVIRLAQLMSSHYFPTFSTLSERKATEFAALLTALARCTRASDTARSQLTKSEKFLAQFTTWFVHDAVEFVDEANAVALLSNMTLGVCQAVARQAAPTLLTRVAQVCMDVQATPEVHTSCLHLLAQCLGGHVDAVDQTAWEYAFVPMFLASSPLEHALDHALGSEAATHGLVVLQGCLKYGGYSMTPFPVPLAVILAVVAALGSSTNPIIAVEVLQQLVTSTATRRLIAMSSAFDSFVKVVSRHDSLLGQSPVQSVARQLVDDAIDIHVPRDEAIVPLLLHKFLPKDTVQLSVLSLLGHLALFSPQWCSLVLAQVQSTAPAMVLLSKHVESIHARTCSRASINATAVVSTHDMLRVYLFAITLKELTWTDVSTAVCFVSDILSWFTSQKSTPRFVDIYPVLLYCTSCLLKPTAKTNDVSRSKQINGQRRSSSTGILDDDEPWQVDILRDVVHILTVATDIPIQVSGLNTLVAINKLWQSDRKLLQLVEGSPTKAMTLQRIVGLVVTTHTAALEVLTLMVTSGHQNLVDELKAIGTKDQLESLQDILQSSHDKAMTTAILDLLGYSMDLSEAFVLDLHAFADDNLVNNPAERSALMTKLKATLDMGVVTDHAILTAVVPVLVETAARDRTFVNECVQCLGKVAGFPAFAQCPMAPPILLRLYVNEYLTLTPDNQDLLLDMLFMLQSHQGDFDWHDDWHALDKLLGLAASVLVCQVSAAARIMTFVWSAVAGHDELLHLVASQAHLLVPLCAPVLTAPPPPMSKKIDQLAKPNQVVHVVLVRLVHALSTLSTLSPDMLKPFAPLVESLVHCLATYPLHSVAKQQPPQLAYLSDIASIVLQFATHVDDTTFFLDKALKQLMGAVESLPPSHLGLRNQLLQLLAALTQLPPVVGALHRLQGLDSFVRLFHSSTAKLDQQAHILACLAQSARIGGLESEVIARLVGHPSSATELLQCLNRSSREPQEHAAYLLSALLLLRPDLGGTAGCVSMLVECLEAVDIVVVRYVLVCLSSILHVDGTQETLLRHATVPVLAQILQKADDVCTEHVLRVLAILCSKHKVTVCRRVVAANLLGILMSTVQQQVGQRRSNVFHAAWVLSCISKDKDLVFRMHEVDCDFVLNVVQQIDLYPLPTINKLLRFVGNVWTHESAGLPVAGIVRKLLGLVPMSENAKVQKNGGRVLSLLFVLPEMDALEDIVLALAQYLFDTLPSSLDKLVAASLVALVDGLQQPDSTTDRCIRSLVAEEGDHFLHMLRLLSPNSFHPVTNRLLLALQFLTALVDSNEMVQRLEPMLLPPLLHLLSNDPLEHLNSSTIKQLLGLLSGLTRSNASSLAMSPIVVGAIKRLVGLAQEDDSYHTEALHVLVNFASVSDLRQSIVLHGGLAALLLELEDDMVDAHLQLVLLGVANLSADDLAKQTVQFAPHVPRFLALLSVPNANVQALAVWIVSNICVIDAVRRTINAENGATVLQSLLNEVNSPAVTSRPLSSSKRIREMAPKAIQDLGFAPLHL